MNHLAIDLETLSLEPNAHILSIGAVFFDPATGEMGDSFYVEIDPQHEQPGAHVSASTRRVVGVSTNRCIPQPR